MNILKVFVLSCCAVVALGASHRQGDGHHRHHQRYKTAVSSLSSEEPSTRQQIYAILEKLYTGRGVASYARTIREDPPRDIIERVLDYAQGYASALLVKEGPSIDERSRNASAFWGKITFEHRVRNFGWENLPAPQQYHAMARVMLRLVELAKREWGGREGILDIQLVSRRHNVAEIEHELKHRVKELVQFYNINDDASPPGQSSSSVTPLIGRNIETNNNALHPAALSGEEKIRRNIHALFTNLFVPSDPAQRHESPYGSLLRATAPPNEIIKDALEYAYCYVKALEVKFGPKISEYAVFWSQKSFQQRVHNFGWDHLPSPKQYHAMARAMVKLIERIEEAWGGRGGELEKVAKESSIMHYPTATEIKTNLQRKIADLCHVYNFDDIPPPGPPFDSPPVAHTEETTLVGGETAASVLMQLDDAFNRLREDLFSVVNGLLQTQDQPPPSPQSNNGRFHGCLGPRC